MALAGTYYVGSKHRWVMLCRKHRSQIDPRPFKTDTEKIWMNNTRAKDAFKGRRCGSRASIRFDLVIIGAYMLMIFERLSIALDWSPIREFWNNHEALWAVYSTRWVLHSYQKLRDDSHFWSVNGFAQIQQWPNELIVYLVHRTYVSYDLNALSFKASLRSWSRGSLSSRRVVFNGLPSPSLSLSNSESDSHPYQPALSS